MKRVAVLTGAELRHEFVRKAIALAPEIEVVASICEGTERSLKRIVETSGSNTARLMHLAEREQAEEDYFSAFCTLAPDKSAARFVAKGQVNDPAIYRDLIELRPDVVLAYGCSLIREPLLSAFPRRFINVHLGLSPYRRGSGTNFWPLVEGRPELVGATFMHIDAGVDTGEIIHHLRARIYPGDSIHDIGNRLITDVALTYAEIARRYDELVPLEQIAVPDDVKVYRKADFDEQSVARMRQNFRDGMIDRYLSRQHIVDAAVPILHNPAIASVAALRPTR